MCVCVCVCVCVCGTWDAGGGRSRTSQLDRLLLDLLRARTQLLGRQPVRRRLGRGARDRSRTGPTAATGAPRCAFQ